MSITYYKNVLLSGSSLTVGGIIEIGADTAADQTILKVREGSGVNKPYLYWAESIYGLPYSGLIWKQIGEVANLACVSTTSNSTVVSWSEAADQDSNFTYGGGSPNVITDGMWWSWAYNGQTDDGTSLYNYTPALGEVEALNISSSLNPTYKFTGYITGATAQKTFTLQLSDTDDYINFNREDTNVLGLKINMPVVTTSTIDATGFEVSSVTGIDATIPIAPVAPATVSGSATFTKGILTAYTAPT